MHIEIISIIAVFGILVARPPARRLSLSSVLLSTMDSQLLAFLLHMLALVYPALVIYLGNFLYRRLYQFVSVPQGYTAPVLAGLLVSSPLTCLARRTFASTSGSDVLVSTTART
jgi:hypothetical protein